MVVEKLQALLSKFVSLNCKGISHNIIALIIIGEIVFAVGLE